MYLLELDPVKLTGEPQIEQISHFFTTLWFHLRGVPGIDAVLLRQDSAEAVIARGGCALMQQHLSIAIPGPKLAFGWTGVIPVEPSRNSTVLNKNSSWPIIHLHALCPGAKIHSIDKWLGVPQELEALLHRAQTKQCFRQQGAVSFVWISSLRIKAFKITSHFPKIQHPPSYKFWQCKTLNKYIQQLPGSWMSVFKAYIAPD